MPGHSHQPLHHSFLPPRRPFSTPTSAYRPLVILSTISIPANRSLAFSRQNYHFNKLYIYRRLIFLVFVCLVEAAKSRGESHNRSIKEKKHEEEDEEEEVAQNKEQSGSEESPRVQIVVVAVVVVGEGCRRRKTSQQEVACT